MMYIQCHSDERPVGFMDSHSHPVSSVEPNRYPNRQVSSFMYLKKPDQKKPGIHFWSYLWTFDYFLVCSSCSSILKIAAVHDK